MMKLDAGDAELSGIRCILLFVASRQMMLLASLLLATLAACANGMPSPLMFIIY